MGIALSKLDRFEGLDAHQVGASAAVQQEGVVNEEREQHYPQEERGLNSGLAQRKAFLQPTGQ